MEPNQTTAKLFKNGSSQAVRLPKEFRFEGDEVLISKVGSKVIIEPKLTHDEWMRKVRKFFESPVEVSDDFMSHREKIRLRKKDVF